ncbi:alpha/beta hydrolase fold domain-containing protein [Uniformispora flossi]|uniref:alpha/beta hydrolase fold domain-containing protein n=1 Tax=Uniformispora flossi TaxID=3390723 RepID=UPI003C30DF14
MHGEDVTLPGAPAGVRARVHRAADVPAAALGASLMWMHGGAFIGGTMDMPEGQAVCAGLAAAGVTCLNVDYRLAPGFGRRRAQRAPDAVRYPLPLDDCASAWDVLTDAAPGWGLHPDRMHVGGASAGGALAASLALRLCRAGTPPAGAALAYPLLHATLPPAGPDLRRALRGRRRLGTFTASSVRWMTTNYVGRSNTARLPEALPGGQDLVGFPPTLIVNSERDSLRASGEQFADELRAAGTAIQVQYEPGTRHGHLNNPDHPAFARTLAKLAAWLTTPTHPEPAR